jgi:hypothetical protein
MYQTKRYVIFKKTNKLEEIKMKKLLMVLSASAIMVLGACSESDVSTGGSGNTTEKKLEAKETKKEDTGKTIDATNQKVEAAGMKVGLGEVKVTADKISVGINLENTTDKALSFYPDQGKMVIGDMQLDANMFMTSGSVGGDVQSGVKQEGVIEFLAPEGKKIDVKTVKQIKLVFGDVVTEDYMTTEPVNFTVEVK